MTESARIYTVKEAAKIVGVSTNTLYKYLLEGKIKSTRGTAEGRFRIPQISLEEFLGAPLKSPTPPPPQPIKPIVQTSAVTPPIVDSVTHTRQSKRPMVRLLIVCILIAFIIDTIVSPYWTPASAILRIGIVTCLIVIAYPKRSVRAR